jgi:flagellar FliL protein
MLARMSSKAALVAPAQDVDPTPAPENKPGGKRRLILLGAPLLLAATLAGLWFSGILPDLIGLGPAHRSEAAAKPPPAPVFVDMPEAIVNLNAGQQHRPNYLKLQARLEVARVEDADRVRAAMPRLQDMFQTYLREMRPEELRGSAGTYRLREELIARANLAAAPARVVDVLFTQLLVQ